MSRFLSDSEDANDRQLPELSSELKNIVAGASDLTGTFCCGGIITAARPIAVACLGAEANQQPFVLSLPTHDAGMDDLIGVCSTAKFGKGTEAVLDPTYRKALALEPASFFANFSLDEYGILYAIQEVMVPSAARVTAELYKLNVHCPGDFFKAHVDTPRSNTMFGTLVVCLPQPHTGGQLVVRHKDQVKTNDWVTNLQPGQVQWVAFYSDCEHEVLPVTSGHRVTLTYNLYRSDPTDAPSLPCLMPNTTRLHSALLKAFQMETFMPRGGTLGFACEHAYPHTQAELCKLLPTLLKGGDALLYAVAAHLGLKTRIKAVYDMKALYVFPDENYVDEDYVDGFATADGDDDMSDGVEKRGIQYRLPMTDSDEDMSDHDERRGIRYDERRGIRCRLADARGAYATDKVLEWGHTRNFLSAIEGRKRMDREADKTGSIVWCRQPSQWALQMVSAAYGNEPSTKAWYSAAAILVHVPAWGSDLRHASLKHVCCSSLVPVQPFRRRKFALKTLIGKTGHTSERCLLFKDG